MLCLCLFSFFIHFLSHSETNISFLWEVIRNMGEQAGILASKVLFLDLPLSQETILNYWFKYWEGGVTALSTRWRKFYFGYIPQLFCKLLLKTVIGMLVVCFMRKSRTDLSYFLVLKLRVNLPLKILLHPSNYNNKELQSLTWWVENCLHYNIFNAFWLEWAKLRRCTLFW